MALVPSSLLRLLRHHGVLALRARDRDRIVLSKPVEGVGGDVGEGEGSRLA